VGLRAARGSRLMLEGEWPRPLGRYEGGKGEGGLRESVRALLGRRKKQEDRLGPFSVEGEEQISRKGKGGLEGEGKAVP